MSLHAPQKQQQQNSFASALLGSVLAVILSVPAAAYTAAFLGDTYEIRVTIYCLFLLWAIIGSILLFSLTYKSTTQPTNSIWRVLRWFISVWLWPIMLLMSKRKKKSSTTS